MADYVLDNISRLMSCLRECNTTLRWVMLHTAVGGWGVSYLSFFLLYSLSVSILFSFFFIRLRLYMYFFILYSCVVAVE